MSESALATTFRTHLCGALREEHVGASVRLGGWVHRSRDLGGLVFFDLRDRAGLIQVSVDLSKATPATSGVAFDRSTDTWIRPARSRRSKNTSPPRSRERCTQPPSLTDAPTCSSRSAPQRWVRKVVASADSDIQCGEWWTMRAWTDAGRRHDEGAHVERGGPLRHAERDAAPMWRRRQRRLSHSRVR